MADAEQDIILLVELEVAQRVSSFALDIGVSLAKIVYRSKKDYRDGEPVFIQRDTKVGRLRLALLQGLEPEALIQFIRDNVDRPEVTSSPTSIPATDAGSTIYRRQLEQALNIKIEQIPEWDGFAAGLFFLEGNDSLQPLGPEPSIAGESDGIEQAQRLLKVIQNVKTFSDMKVSEVDPTKEDKQVAVTVSNVPTQNRHSSTDDGGLDEPAEDNSTCLLVVIGTAAAWFQVGRTGPVKFVDRSSTSGCTFVGLGRLLTRSNKTFLELIDLAKQGDQRQVDILPKDLIQDVDQGDLYSSMAGDVTLASFGKAMTNPDAEFKDADMIASLLDSFCLELVRVTRLIAKVNGLKKVYMAGNFVSNSHVRRIMTREIITYRKVFSSDETAPDIRFLRHGGYLGAIGTMMLDANRQQLMMK